MATLQWQEPIDVRVGDSGKVRSFLVTEADSSTVRNITGYAAWVSFWYQGAVPHVVRAAPVDGSNGKIKYRFQGDEFPTAGTVYCHWTIAAPDYDATALGRGYFQLSGPSAAEADDATIRFKVKA